MANQSDDLLLFIGAPHEPGDLRIPPKLVGRPASGDDDGLKVVCAHRAGGNLARGRERILALHGVIGFRPHKRHIRPLFSQAHHGDPELQILKTFLHKDGDTFVL